jgi:hypothetical protein
MVQMKKSIRPDHNEGNNKAQIPLFVRPPEKSQKIDPVRLMEKKKEINPSLPPLFELASLAATLAHGRQINQASAEQLADEAFELWTACYGRREKRLTQQAYREIGREYEAARKAALPKPREYPVSFDEFLRLVIGGKDKADRLKIYRDYVKHMIWIGHIRALEYPSNPADKLSLEEAIKTALPASIDEVEAWIKHDKQRQYAHEELFAIDARSLLEWLAEQPKARARHAAVKRWSQKRRHKANSPKIKALLDIAERQ